MIMYIYIYIYNFDYNRLCNFQVILIAKFFHFIDYIFKTYKFFTITIRKMELPLVLKRKNMKYACYSCLH